MSSTPLILGHRGASAVAPENTIAAFSRALRDGADGIEFDVRLSLDQLPVVIHDDSLKRTAGLDLLVSGSTVEELKTVDVGSWFGVSRAHSSSESFHGESLPLLSDVFDFFKAKTGLLYVEMKCESDQGPVLAAEVVRLVQEFQFGDRVVVESFDLPSILEIKKSDSGIRTAALFEPRLSHPISTVRRIKLIDRALQHQADEIALHHTLAGDGVVKAARQHGLEVVVWTVDEPSWVDRAQELGVKALIANNPAIMLDYRSRVRL